jgi:hypothetical protein
MDQVPTIDPVGAHDAPPGRSNPAGTRGSADRRLEHASRILLQVGAVLAALLVLLPALGVAALLLYAASLDMWHGIEHQVTAGDRVGLLSLAAMVAAVAAVCEGVVLRSIRQGWVALVMVVLGGIACLYICLRGLIQATGKDDTIVTLSVAVGAMGVVLALGAGLGMAGRLRGDRPRPRPTGRPH